MRIKEFVRLFLVIYKGIRCFRKDRGAFGFSYKISKVMNKKKYKQLAKYKNIHRDGKCFIVGTGPSLKIEDVEMLMGKVSIGVNTLYKIYDKTEWRATYYCIIDPSTFSSIGEFIKKYHKDTLFIAGNRISVTDKDINQFSLECSSFYRMPYLKFFDTPCSFSDDISDEVCDGASVVFAALQIAIYMGFKEIYLLGVDCNYTLPIENLHGGALSYSKDYNYNWTKQTGLTMIEGFKVAKKYADAHDIKIFNATRGGMLEVFPRVNLEDVVVLRD